MTESPTRPVQILAPTGELAGEPPQGLSDDDLTALLRLMMLGRRIDQKAISLQRRGKLGTYAPLSGQEAASVGAAFALSDDDYLVPQYREQLAMLHKGLKLSTYLLQRMGHPAGSELPEHGKLWPQQVALAAHLPHAVGQAWGLRLRGEAACVLVCFGDGASSEGDFHEACNLAGVQKAPVIFQCQNNGWAISTPIRLQTAAASIADRGPGYGMPGVLVDGNDVLAMYEVTRAARERALAGEGPTLIEARTTRLGAHTTADDPTRYTTPDQVEAWRGLDPIPRFRAWLTATQRWDDEADALATKWCDDEIERAVEEFDATPRPDPDLLFQHVYADEHVRLTRQRAAFHRDREAR